MSLDFDLPSKYYTQAETIVTYYMRKKYPRFISISDVSIDFIKNIGGYSANHIFIELLSYDFVNNRSVDWSNQPNESDKDYSAETFRRVQWLYKGKTNIEVDKYFVGRILKTIEDVTFDNLIRDFL